MAENTITLAEYLFVRLSQLVCRALHGLPGDFKLTMLDYVESSGLRCIGNANELNAGYATDAYARKHGIGAICKTFGVGELSAVNAIAGSYAERVPVVHIVGTPGRPSQRNGMLLHHTLGNGDYHVFARIHREITIAQADLIDPATAPAEIDRVLRTCYFDSQPVHMQIPTAMVAGRVSATLLGFILSTVQLLSLVVLPPKVTRSSYLTVALLTSIMILELGFIVPLARKSPQSYDPVTPNGMHSNNSCAAGGGMVAYGLMGYTSWVLVRSLFMHLQIVWNISPADTSYIVANIVAWSTTIGLTSAVLAHVGVSFRFGGYCHVNVGSYSTHWGRILAFGAIALILQLGTFAYCMKVYLASAIAMRNDSSQRSVSVTGSSRSRTARATARRVRQVLIFQWRRVAMVSLAISATAFVCIVFIVYDNRITVEAFANTDELIPWILSMIATQDPSHCIHLTGPIIISQSLALATVYLLALVGPVAFFLLFHWETLKGWWELFRKDGWRTRRGSGSSGGSKEQWGQSTTQGTEMGTQMSTSQRRKSDRERDQHVGPMEIESPKDASGLMRQQPLQDSPVSSSLEAEKKQGTRPSVGPAQ